MIELGNVDQIKDALENKTGLIKEYEKALIERVAIIEKEQDEGTEYSVVSKVGAAILIIISLVITAWLFI